MSMSFTKDPDFSDVLNDNYLGTTLTVGTSQVEAKVGGSRLAGRETLLIYNSSSNPIYFGPTGVTTSNGIPISKGGYQEIPAGSDIAVYLIAGSSSNVIIVQELG